MTSPAFMMRPEIFLTLSLTALHEQNLTQVDGVPSVEGSDAAFCQENSGPPLRSEEEDSGRRRAQEEKERFLMGGWRQPRSVWGVGLLWL